MSARTGIGAAAIALVALAPGCGAGEDGAADPPSPAGAAAPGTLTSARYAGTLAKPRQPAPPLALEDSFGRPVDLKRFHGDAVIVTFLYVNCPDVCPLIVDNLRAAQSELGPAADEVHVVAVSVDPEGDTPEQVNAFLAAHRVTKRISYLMGSRAELEAIWHDWGIVSKRSPTRKDPHLVEHSAMVYGVNADGEIVTLYPTSFDPAQIVHDIPILASQ